MYKINPYHFTLKIINGISQLGQQTQGLKLLLDLQEFSVTQSSNPKNANYKEMIYSSQYPGKFAFLKQVETATITWGTIVFNLRSLRELIACMLNTIFRNLLFEAKTNLFHIPTKGRVTLIDSNCIKL